MRQCKEKPCFQSSWNHQIETFISIAWPAFMNNLWQIVHVGASKYYSFLEQNGDTVNESPFVPILLFILKWQYSHNLVLGPTAIPKENRTSSIHAPLTCGVAEIQVECAHIYVIKITCVLRIIYMFGETSCNLILNKWNGFTNVAHHEV